MKLAEDIEKWLYLLPCANTRLGLSERGKHRRIAEGGRSLVRPEHWQVLAAGPVAGRVFAPLTLNAYGYCVNDPVRFYDFNGEIIDTLRKTNDY